MHNFNKGYMSSVTLYSNYVITVLVTVISGATGGVIDNPQIVDGGSSFILSCNATGIPIPTITWTMNNMTIYADDIKVIEESSKAGVKISNLTILNFETADTGVYNCIANKSDGSVLVSSDIRLISKYLCPTYAPSLKLNLCTLKWIV